MFNKDYDIIYFIYLIKLMGQRQKTGEREVSLEDNGNVDQNYSLASVDLEHLYELNNIENNIAVVNRVRKLVFHLSHQTDEKLLGIGLTAADIDFIRDEQVDIYETLEFLLRMRLGMDRIVNPFFKASNGVVTFINDAVRDLLGADILGQRLDDVFKNNLGCLQDITEMLSASTDSGRPFSKMAAIEIKNRLTFYRIIGTEVLYDHKLGCQVQLLKTSPSRALVYGLNYKNYTIEKFITMVAKIAVEEDAQDTAPHLSRVMQNSGAFAEYILKNYQEQFPQLDEQYVYNIKYFSVLHDIGKMIIDKQILKKPCRHNSYEWQNMKSHVIEGEKMARAANLPQMALNIIMYHHAFFDGSQDSWDLEVDQRVYGGYPYPIKGDNIPLEAQIVALIDTFDAITAKRVYSKSKSKDLAFSIIKKASGTQFNPVLVTIFGEMYENLVVHK